MILYILSSLEDVPSILQFAIEAMAIEMNYLYLFIFMYLPKKNTGKYHPTIGDDPVPIFV